MIVEYDRLYNKSVVWLVKSSLRFEMFKGSKRACEKFLKNKKGKIDKWEF